MSKQPMAEVFGFPINNISLEASRNRVDRLCPYNNKVPNCTKDKANNPLGVCSVFDGDNTSPVITCPIRFRENWLISGAAARFFFPEGTHWTSLTEVRLPDKYGKSAGNIDLVLVSYDDSGQVIDFGSCEVQAVYISGNIRKPYEYFMEDPKSRSEMDWEGRQHYPNPDFLSSSRKRLAPQLLFKGGILNSWGKKQVVVLDAPFYETLPKLPTVPADEADLAWLVYELVLNAGSGRYDLILKETVYTKFAPTMLTVTTAEPGLVGDFIAKLQIRLDAKMEINAPDAPTLSEVLTQEGAE
ncbi:MAG: NotI family restriction endonuclease [Candidatus Nanopelagicaceae bacterium]